jgi:hypothetical protein
MAATQSRLIAMGSVVSVKAEDRNLVFDAFSAVDRHRLLPAGWN